MIIIQAFRLINELFVFFSAILVAYLQNMHIFADKIKITKP